MEPGTEAGAGSAVFQTRGLTKTYDQGEVQVHALRGVDLDLYGGELVVMLGASGSGKSTLLNILGGLDVPSTGEVGIGILISVLPATANSPVIAVNTWVSCSSSIISFPASTAREMWRQ